MATSYSMRQSLDRMLKIGQPEGSAYLAEVREILEPEIAALAATRVDDEDLASMREQIAVMDSSRKDPDAFIEADLDFHLALAEAAANPLILSLIDSIVGLLRDSGWEFFRWKGARSAGSITTRGFWRPSSTAIRWSARCDEGALAAGARGFAAGAERAGILRTVVSYSF